MTEVALDRLSFSRAGTLNRGCRFDGCENPHKSSGLCNGHYQQERKGMELRQLRGVQKECSFSQCMKPIHAHGLCPGHLAQKKRGQPLTALNVFRVYTSSRTCEEPGCETVMTAKGRCARHYMIFTKYGLTKPAFDKMLADQKYRCANDGCGATAPGGQGEWHIDHDHACCDGYKSCGECIRGLLCSRCNLMLGYARDNADVLVGAINYLRKGAP